MKTAAAFLTLEKFLAFLGCAVCLVTCLRLLQVLSADPHQTLFPLPALYLLELSLLSGLSILGAFTGEAKWIRATWAAGGALLAFILMGSFSIGFAFIPTALLVFVTAWLGSRRYHLSLLRGVGLIFGAGLIQIVLMFMAIRLLYPDTIF